jgi:nucleoside-diphosphate-sugar epimerase
MKSGCTPYDGDREHVVVTGAAGLTGATLCRALSSTHVVHAISRSTPKTALSPSVCWHQLDLSAGDFVADLPPRVDHLVHLAQSRHFREFPAQANDVFAINVAAAARLLDYARRVGCSNVVIASTGSVYRPSSHLLREDEPLDISGGAGYYAASKLASEMLAGAYAGEFRGLTILRPFFIYGPGQEQGMLVPRLITSVREGTAVKLAGKDGFRFTPLFVADAVAAVTAGLSGRGSHVINIGGPEVLTLRSACHDIGRVVGREPLFESNDAEPGDLVPDLSRMRALLGEPQVRFADGLRGMLSPLASGTVGTTVDGGL